MTGLINFSVWRNADNHRLVQVGAVVMDSQLHREL
jgi:hypothetical protein